MWLAHGQGTEIIGGTRRSEYVGQWKEGKRHGKGAYTIGEGNNKCVYIGHWKNNM